MPSFPNGTRIKLVRVPYDGTIFSIPCVPLQLTKETEGMSGSDLARMCHLAVDEIWCSQVDVNLLQTTVAVSLDHIKVSRTVIIVNGNLYSSSSRDPKSLPYSKAKHSHNICLFMSAASCQRGCQVFGKLKPFA